MKTLKAKKSTPKFNSIENGELTKGLLETVSDISAMSKEQASSTLNGC